MGKGVPFFPHHVTALNRIFRTFCHTLYESSITRRSLDQVLSGFKVSVRTYITAMTWGRGYPPRDLYIEFLRTYCHTVYESSIRRRLPDQKSSLFKVSVRTLYNSNDVGEGAGTPLLSKYRGFVREGVTWGDPGWVPRVTALNRIVKYS